MTPVIMYSSGVCPYCQRAETLLKARGVTAIEKIRVDLEPARRDEMIARTGRRTVPQIFIGDTHVGGFDELSSPRPRRQAGVAARLVNRHQPGAAAASLPGTLPGKPMTDTSPATAATTPVFQVQRVYLKDASLEMPNAPSIFLESENPKVDVQLEVSDAPVDRGAARGRCARDGHGQGEGQGAVPG